MIQYCLTFLCWLQANSDVIATVQVGFIGTWGEWYYSKNYATPMDGGAWYALTAAQQTSRNTILTALLKALPVSRMVQLRTPTQKQVHTNQPHLRI